MYTSFYKLDKKPFGINPDLSFLWLGEKYGKALSILRSGIRRNKGFLLLTGEAGSGKTTLVEALTENLDEGIAWAVITDPQLERIDFYNAIAKGFGLTKPFTSKVQFLIQFSHFLRRANDEKKKVLLLVDDCHLLSQEMLEELRLLASIEKADVKLFNIFFVGQPAFNDMLAEPKNKVMNQRLIFKAKLQALNVNESDEYIRHRLKVAGTTEELFSAQAVHAVHRFSQGIPRWINAICGCALVGGSAQAKQVIDGKMIEACIQKMDLPETCRNKDFAAFADEKPGGNFFYDKGIPGLTQIMSSFWRLIPEKAHKGGWLKYGLGLLLLFMAGIYFWYSTTHILESTRKVSGEIARVPEMTDVSQLSSSPAVAILKEKSSESTKNKAIQVQTTIRQTTIRIRPLVTLDKKQTTSLQTEEPSAGSDRQQ